MMDLAIEEFIVTNEEDYEKLLQVRRTVERGDFQKKF